MDFEAARRGFWGVRWKVKIMVDYKKIVSFYKGKRVLVTGNTGFKGAWLTRQSPPTLLFRSSQSSVSPLVNLFYPQSS